MFRRRNVIVTAEIYNSNLNEFVIHVARVRYSRPGSTLPVYTGATRLLLGKNKFRNDNRTDTSNVGGYDRFSFPIINYGRVRIIFRTAALLQCFLEHFLSRIPVAKRHVSSPPLYLAIPIEDCVLSWIIPREEISWDSVFEKFDSELLLPAF